MLMVRPAAIITKCSYVENELKQELIVKYFHLN